MIRALVLLIAVTGCSTVGNRYQYLSVGSVPDGAFVSTTKSPKISQGGLGKTPLFYEMETAPAITLYGLRPRSPALKVSKDCSFAWGSVLLGNLPIAAALGPAIGGVYFAVAVGTDLVSGNSFRCPARVGLNLALNEDAVELEKRPPQGVPKRQCKRIAVIPPYHFQSDVSEAIFDEWTLSVAEKLKPCDSFVPWEESRAAFLALGLSFDKPSYLGNIDQWQLNELGFRTKATHIAFLQTYRSEAGAFATSTLFELHTRAKKSLPLVRIETLSDSVFTSGFVQAIDQSFMFLPNSIQLSSFYYWPQFSQVDSNYKFFRNEGVKDYKSYLGGWELGFVPRTSSYRSPAIRFISSVSLWSHLMQTNMLMYWRYSNVTPPDNVYEFKEVMDLWFLGLTSENRLFLMSRFGAPFVGAGVGLAWTQGTLRGQSSDNTLPYFHAYGGYLLEASQSGFLEVTGGVAKSTDPFYKSVYTTVNDFVYLRVKGGFYLDSLRQALRSAW